MPIRTEERQRRMRFADPWRCWAEIRRRKEFRMADLVATGAHRRSAAAFVQRLMDAGIVASDDRAGRNRGKFGVAVYTLVKDIGRRCPRFTSAGELNTRPTAQERMWAAMKPLRQGFFLPELEALARIDTENTLKSYVKALHRAGYVEVVQTIPHRFASRYPTHRYRLVKSKNTGPEAPVILRDGAVWDPNLDAIVWAPEATAEPDEVAA